ncbi:MBL fold metallo-hydrolase [Paenibacillus pini]|uniref:Outer membrane protein romA n=1 Tax=Paenibacillus pini JCM 16418 TaxID=1236976 RepID=W7Z7U5_9BACL|nr:MBL fold metallo-hydrolase [Paenibacillus pini]GAF10484.1 outer membrane protein romA [Paenibacillus pini JCM 16418]
MPKIRYNNMDNISTDKTLKQFRQWRNERRQKKKDYSSYQVPNVQPELDYLHQNRQETAITWIGHSTFFIQYEGLNMITDPVWARRMGFERRLGEPGLSIDDVPPLDVMLISHSHYDHMHLASIRKLYRAGTKLIVPIGLKSKMIRKGFHNCVEMKWWEHIVVGNVRISFVPTQHWTRRTPFDTNTSHWGGFVLEPVEPPVLEEEGNSASRGVQSLPPNLYFAGDSGYFPGFKEIGEKFNIHVALMPIGAYEPEWFMTSQHTNPEEALRAFLDVKAETMIPMHYGTFKLADDTAREALDRMENERIRLNIEQDRIQILSYGQTLRIHPELRRPDL